MCFECERNSISILFSVYVTEFVFLISSDRLHTKGKLALLKLNFQTAVFEL